MLNEFCNMSTKEKRNIIYVNLQPIISLLFPPYTGKGHTDTHKCLHCNGETVPLFFDVQQEAAAPTQTASESK